MKMFAHLQRLVIESELNFNTNQGVSERNTEYFTELGAEGKPKDIHFLLTF